MHFHLFCDPKSVRFWVWLESKRWFLIPFLRRILSLQWPSRTADLRSVFSSVLPKPLISWWIPVVHCLMQNEKISTDSQSKVCWKNMGRKQVYVSLAEKKNSTFPVNICTWNCHIALWVEDCTGHMGGDKRHLWNAAADLATSIHLNNSVTKWLMTHWQDRVPPCLDYSRH